MPAMEGRRSMFATPGRVGFAGLYIVRDGFRSRFAPRFFGSGKTRLRVLVEARLLKRAYLDLQNREKLLTFEAKFGKMQEWLNWPAWKASNPLKGFRGSNPLLSAW